MKKFKFKCSRCQPKVIMEEMLRENHEIIYLCPNCNCVGIRQLKPKVPPFIAVNPGELK